ncbi:MAG: ATP-binding protein, partial [Motiliproteus sp.]|nr:ATP-binding protein [Motiliproteus sp.]
MKLLSRISHLGIRQRVLILALVPMLMITLTLSGYMITSRLASERENLFNNGMTLLSYLSTGAEFDLFSDNASALALLAKAPLQRSEVSDVIFINAGGEIIYRDSDIEVDISTLNVPSTSSLTPQPERLRNLWLLKAPVLLSGNSIDDFDSESSDIRLGSPEVLGWVILLINEEALKQNQSEIALRGLLITLVGLSLTIWLALTIGRSITQPIQGIIETIYRLRQEEFDARITVKNRGEIGELEEGINSLASKVQRTRIRLQDQIDVATKNLRLTLDRLEKKNIDLVNAKRRAEKANLAKDQFLARMSHELRTPLTSVMGFIKLLQKTELSGEQKEYSQIVNRTSNLLLSLIDDILDFSKLQSDAIQIEKIPFNLEQVIEDTLAMQAATAFEKDVELYFISDPQLPGQLVGDPTRIKQVVSNLVSNAVKFTASGHVTIQLQCSAINTTEVDLKISVVDTGIGIDGEKLASLFQPFIQADTSITRRFGGSGLGLVITKHLMELMDGTVTLNSQVNQGTTAVVELSLQLADDQPAIDEIDCSRLLIYSHSQQARAELQSCTRKWGCNASIVEDQRQLLAHLKAANNIDGLILDLPKSGPGQYYQRQLLRSIRHRYDGKIILTVPRNSAFAEPNSEEAELFEPLIYLPRPVNRPRLLEALKNSGELSAHISIQPATISNQTLLGVELLVAEDNDFNRLLLRKILEQAGAKPVMVTNGEQALAQARQKHYNCILMDVHMPLMDGIEASRLIRLLPPPLNETPILALTANVIANEEQALKQAGVETTLFKPI